MRVIKIDVVKKDVYEMDIQGGFKSMCEALESNGYDGIRLSSTERLWVDDEGLLKDKPLGAFDIDPYPQTLSGHGLIIGLRGPESVSTNLSVDYIKSIVTFVNADELPDPSITVYNIVF